MRRSAEDAKRTRLSLCKAALMVFEEKGWRGATFEAISERAGVTRGALHHHFGDKRALLREALSWGWSEYGKRLFAESNGDVEAASWLSGLFTAYVQLLSKDLMFRALAYTTVFVAPQGFGRVPAKASIPGEETPGAGGEDADSVEENFALGETTPKCSEKASGWGEKASGWAEKSSGLDRWHAQIAESLASALLPAGALPPDQIASLTLVLLQGFTVTAVTRPQDLPQPQGLDAAVAALVRGLLS